MLKKSEKITVEEKRAERRIPINLTVNIRCYGQVYSGQTRNISKYGMFIEAIGFVGKDDCEISIMMAADGTLHRMEGEIVWVNRKSSSKTEKSFRSLGVRLTEAQSDYLNYIEYLKHETRIV